MADELQHYAVSPADWRRTLRQNNFRTYIIIALILFDLLRDWLACRYVYGYNLLSASDNTAIISRTDHIQDISAWLPASCSSLLAFHFLSVIFFTTSSCFWARNIMKYRLGTSSLIPEQQLYNVVEEMKIAAGLRYMPKVFIIDADYMNAFASGYSEKSAMVAITRGLMEKLNRDELQAVMAHELSHIRHLDIKLTLTASLLSNLTIMALDILFYNAIFSGGGRRDGEDNRSRNGLFMIIMVLRYLLPVISVLLLLYLSRTRELMADAGSVELMRTNQPLASALMKISDDHTQNRDKYNAEYKQTPHENVRREAYIYDPTQAGIESIASVSELFSTHPSLATRLAALGFKRLKKNRCCSMSRHFIVS